MAEYIQFDFFEPLTEKEVQDHKIDAIKDALRRTQKRFFAQNKELMTIIIRQSKEIEGLQKRMERLIKEK